MHSDKHKLLLLKAPGIFELVALGMFVDPEHPMGPNPAPPQQPTPAAMQAIYQRNYTEAACQLALFPPGREALREQAAILKALEEVAERGLTPEAQEFAQGALMALSDKEMQATAAEGPKHIMLSYQVCAPVSLVEPRAHACLRVPAPDRCALLACSNRSGTARA